MAGCTSTRFVVVDANTHEPIADVHMAGFRSFSYQRVPDDNTWVEVDSGVTNATGNAATRSHPASIVRADNEFRFVFSKPGYKTAEALIFSDRTLVASPADDAGWRMADKDDRKLRGMVPTKNFEETGGKETIIVPLYPTDPPPPHRRRARMLNSAFIYNTAAGCQGATGRGTPRLCVPPSSNAAQVCSTPTCGTRPCTIRRFRFIAGSALADAVSPGGRSASATADPTNRTRSF